MIIIPPQSKSQGFDVDVEMKFDCLTTCLYDQLLRVWTQEVDVKK